MASNDFREWADRQFGQKSDSARKTTAAAREREVAAREIRAKTERLKALRLARDAAENASQADGAAEGSDEEKG